VIRYLWPSVAILVIVGLGWTSLELALESDGLKQVVAENRRSTEALLSYIEVATRCDVEPDVVAKAVNGTIYREPGGAVTDVARLAFKAEFKEGRLQSVQIVNVGKASLCQPR
jgi:hypothetical protein